MKIILLLVGKISFYHVILHPSEVNHMKTKALLNLSFSPRDIEILGWCPAEPVLPHGEKVPL